MAKVTSFAFILTILNLFAISMAFLTKSLRVEHEIPGRALMVRSKPNLFSTTEKSKFSTPSGAFGSALSKETKNFNSSAVRPGTFEHSVSIKSFSNLSVFICFLNHQIGFLKNFLFDAVFSGEKRDYARFYALETIARMPYFSYLR